MQPRWVTRDSADAQGLQLLKQKREWLVGDISGSALFPVTSQSPTIGFGHSLSRLPSLALGQPLLLISRPNLHTHPLLPPSEPRATFTFVCCVRILLHLTHTQTVPYTQILRRATGLMLGSSMKTLLASRLGCGLLCWVSASENKQKFYFPGVFNISVFYYLWSVKFLPDFGILGCMHPWVYVTKL